VAVKEVEVKVTTMVMSMMSEAGVRLKAVVMVKAVVMARVKVNAVMIMMTLLGAENSAGMLVEQAVVLEVGVRVVAMV